MHDSNRYVFRPDNAYIIVYILIAAFLIAVQIVPFAFMEYGLSICINDITIECFCGSNDVRVWTSFQIYWLKAVIDGESNLIT